jgi:hypothetical protein
MRFGPRWKAKAIDEILSDAFALTDQVYITEIGSDARVYKWGEPGFVLDDRAQAHYLQKLIKKVRRYSARTFREIKGIFCWSDLRRQMEWENGHECRLAIVDPTVDHHRRMVGWRGTPASRVLAASFREDGAPSGSVAG